MTDVVLAQDTWTAVLAAGRRTKARADAFAALLPNNSTIELHDGGGLIRTITTGAWTVGSVQADGRYPIRPGTFTDPATGAGTPTLAIVKDAGGDEVCRMSAGVGSGTFRLANALEAGTPIGRGSFVVLYATDDIPIPEPDPEPDPEDPPVITNWVDVIVSDMSLYHDGPARTLQWIRTWGDCWVMPKTWAKPDGWTTAGPWGVIMADYNGADTPPQPWRVAGPYTGNQAPNTRAQIRNMQLWWLRSDQTWILGSHVATPGGQMYHSSWAGEQTTSENAFRVEPDANGGGRSAQYINMDGPYASQYQFDEWHWHFYGSRAQVPAGYIGFATAYFARKILHNVNGADDRSNARLLADAGGDWWITATAQWDNFKTSWPMGHNRYKYLTNDWQLVSFTSITSANIRANPPPLIGL